MNERGNKTFRERLLSQEKADLQLQKTFHLEAKKMYTEKLNKRQRFFYALISIFVFMVTLFFWAVSKGAEYCQMYVFHYTPHQPFESLRLVATWGMFLSIPLVVLSLWPAIRGKVGLRFYPMAVRFIFCILILVIILLSFVIVDFMRHETDYPLSDVTADVLVAATISIIIIIMTIYMLLSGRIDSSYLKNKTKTLELEYRIAELEEKLNQRSSQKPTAE